MAGYLQKIEMKLTCIIDITNCWLTAVLAIFEFQKILILRKTRLAVVKYENSAHEHEGIIKGTHQKI